MEKISCWGSDNFSASCIPHILWNSNVYPRSHNLTALSYRVPVSAALRPPILLLQLPLIVLPSTLRISKSFVHSFSCLHHRTISIYFSHLCYVFHSSLSPLVAHVIFLRSENREYHQAIFSILILIIPIFCLKYSSQHPILKYPLHIFFP
jgi:hypothetical protein